MPTIEYTVADLMTRRVITIGMDDTLRRAKQLFEEHRFHHLVVVEKSKAAGVISDRDLLKHLSPFVGVATRERDQDTATLNRRIHQVMTRALVSVLPEATVVEAARHLIAHNVSCLPVIDEAGKLRGIVTSRDLLRWSFPPEEEVAAAADVVQTPG